MAPVRGGGAPPPGGATPGGATAPAGPVSVAICTYSEDRWDLLCAAVRSVEAQTRRPEETLVVVDHNPALLERVARTFPALTAVANEASVRGPGGARNTAMDRAHGAVVAFLDDDAVAEPDWLEALVSPFADPAVLVTGSRVVPRWSGRPPGWFPDEFDWVIGCSYRGHVRGEGSQPVRNVIANGMAARRRSAGSLAFRVDLGRVGRIPLGCEETEWCIRVRKHYPDATILQVPSAVLVHDVPRQRATVPRFVRHCYAEGLSKAAVTATVGASAGLASERRYVATVLTAGIARRLARATRGQWWDLAQAAAIVIGLCATTAGFVAGRARWGTRLSTRWGDRAVGEHRDHPAR